MARFLLLALVLEVAVGRVSPTLGADGPAVVWGSRFLHYFIAFLGLMTAVVGAWGLLWDGVRFARSGRLAVAATALPFAALAILGVGLGGPPWFRAALYAAFALGLMGLLWASLLGAATHAARAGIFCLAVAPLLQSLSFAVSTYAAALPSALLTLASPAAEVGRAAAILVGIPALLVARPTRPGPWAMAAGAVIASAMAVAFSWHPRLAETVFGLSVPPTGIGQVLALVSIFLAASALVAVWGRTVRRRAVGFGLGLVLLAGAVPTTPAQLIVLYAAFVLLVRGIAASAPEPSGWRDYLAAIARQVEASEPVIIALRDEEVSRMRAEDGPVDVRVVRCGDEILQVDVAMGDPPKALPTLSATHRSASQPRAGRLPEGTGRAHASGAADFDRRIVVKGRGVSDWLDDEVRRLLLALPPGALAVWSGEGARWRSFPARTADPDRPVPLTQMAGTGTPPTEDLIGVVRAVREVARRAGVRC